ncbi:MAG: hypothetical protein FJX23_08945 [Alphaproteobacteria bacterium]|nr:hypothetical protein [Alphaproteobacteria bacterium]
MTENAQPAAKAAEKPKSKKVPVLKIKARTEGFRRAGRSFSAETETVIPLKELDKREIEALKAEPRLLVSETEAEVAGAAGADDEGNNA